MSDKLNESKEKWEEEGIPFFPNHLLKEVIVAFMLIALLLTLATYYPAPMEPPADPFTTPEHIKPEWYFLAAYQGLKAAEYLDFFCFGKLKSRSTYPYRLIYLKMGLKDKINCYLST